jgi:hypothetical protein
MKLSSNKLITLELCKEDALRIIDAMEDYKVKCHSFIDTCDDEQSKEVAWLEWSYVSELLYDLEHTFDLELW